MERTCTKCGSNGPFYPNGGSWCIECRKAHNREWRKNNPERKRELGRKHQYDAHTRLKVELVEAYGGVCTCCGESEIHFLTIEHVNGIPSSHRLSSGKRLSGLALLRKIKSEGYPDTVTVHCMNCNYAKGHYGFCPHQPHGVDQRRY